ncbi:sigma-70 family RNA polymerase sigma factor [Actinomadura rayongensis]|uniref:RNA polymerase sigma factor n=1 Tax=Actinomadura rayongensis TaxID=1429076 RepID=A0A6I4W6A6_9ACTN|nr:sigma-70 family RNA polymerase sigma factor [Actinomadura rayongensis]
MTSEAHRTAETVWRLESGRIIAGVAGVVRDVGLAEELAQDALVAALEQWPESGVPGNPGAWLMTVARRRAVDRIRRDHRYAERLADIGHRMETAETVEADPERIEDDMLRLIFTACHPVLPEPSRVALTLRMLGGLTTTEIARAFLVPEPTVAQRIVRAKKALGDAGVPFEVPSGADRADRLSSVLAVLYLIFNEGYAATSGDDWLRGDLCREALRLGRLLAGLMPREAEAHGLVALMEIQASRARARTGPSGEPVPLPAQDRALWDPLLVRRGFAALLRAREVGGPPGPYVLQAGIAACHARAATAEDTDWTQIAALYDILAGVAPSPVVELNRAVAVGMARGPAAGLKVLDAVAADASVRDRHLFPSVRGDLLERLGRDAEARAEFRRAAELTANEAERRALLRRAGA